MAKTKVLMKKIKLYFLGGIVLAKTNVYCYQNHGRQCIHSRQVVRGYKTICDVPKKLNASFFKIKYPRMIYLVLKASTWYY